MSNLEVRMSFKNLKASKAIEQYMEDKLGKLKKLNHLIQDAHCLFRTDKFYHIVDVTLLGKNIKLYGEGVSDDMYASIDLVTQKLKKQLNRMKERISNWGQVSKRSIPNDKTNGNFHEKIKVPKENIRVKNLMSPKPFTVYTDDNLQFAQDLMNWRYIRHIPVVNDSNEVVGLLTHRDLLKFSFSARDTQVSIPIHEVMQKDIQTIAPGASIQIAADLMLGNKFGCLPVVKKGKLVGILTEADFVRYVSDHT